MNPAWTCFFSKMAWLWNQHSGHGRFSTISIQAAQQWTTTPGTFDAIMLCCWGFSAIFLQICLKDFHLIFGWVFGWFFVVRYPSIGHTLEISLCFQTTQFHQFKWNVLSGVDSYCERLRWCPWRMPIWPWIFLCQVFAGFNIKSLEVEGSSGLIQILVDSIGEVVELTTFSPKYHN